MVDKELEEEKVELVQTSDHMIKTMTLTSLELSAEM